MMFVQSLSGNLPSQRCIGVYHSRGVFTVPAPFVHTSIARQRAEVYAGRMQTKSREKKSG